MTLTDTPWHPGYPGDELTYQNPKYTPEENILDVLEKKMGEPEPDTDTDTRKKQPHYVKTNSPVCSTEYKKVLREVKEKRKGIEGKVAEIQNLKSRFRPSGSRREECCRFR